MPVGFGGLELEALDWRASSQLPETWEKLQIPLSTDGQPVPAIRRGGEN